MAHRAESRPAKVLRLRGGGNCTSRNQPVDTPSAGPHLKKSDQPTFDTSAPAPNALPTSSSQVPGTIPTGTEGTKQEVHPASADDNAGPQNPEAGTDRLDAEHRNAMYYATAPLLNSNRGGVMERVF